MIDEKVEELENALRLDARANGESKQDPGQIERRSSPTRTASREIAELPTDQIGVNLRRWASTT